MNPLPETRAIIPRKPLADLSKEQLLTVVALLLQELLAIPKYIVGKTRLIVAEKELGLIVTETVDDYSIESCETFGEVRPVEPVSDSRRRGT
jgi:hypothetical protein